MCSKGIPCTASRRLQNRFIYYNHAVPRLPREEVELRFPSKCVDHVSYITLGIAQPITQTDHGHNALLAQGTTEPQPAQCFAMHE